MSKLNGKVALVTGASKGIGAGNKVMGEIIAAGGKAVAIGGRVGLRQQ